MAADSLFCVIDRSPTPCWWDDFLTERLLGLEVEAYEAIKAWVLGFSGQTCPYCDEDGLMRSYETIELLQRETERIRLSRPFHK